MKEDRGKLTTEKRNPLSENIDKLSTREILSLINKEDERIAESVFNVFQQTSQDLNSAVDQ